MKSNETLELGVIKAGYKNTFNIDLSDFGLENEIVYFITGCSCVTVPKKIFIDVKKEIPFSINSKSDLLVVNEKKIYLYTLIGEIRNYFHTVKLVYS